MITTQKKLVVDNSSGKVQQDAFMVLHLAPPTHLIFKNGVWRPAFISADVKDVVYIIENNGIAVLVKLSSFIILPFKDITNPYTIADNGCSVGLWKMYFKKKFTHITDETMMAAYWYNRIKD